MKLHTEQERIIQNEQFAFKLRELYLIDKEQFYQVCEFIPYAVHFNRKDNLDIVYSNSKLLNKGKEMELLVQKGSSYLPKISNLILMNRAIEKTNAFDKINDKKRVLSYLQNLEINKQKKFLYSHKLILNDFLYFNISNFTEDMGLIGRVFEEVFKPLEKNGQIIWQKLQSLTKREKEILVLFAKGHSCKKISNMLFLSYHTVDTHKKKIFKKLDVNKSSELVRFSIIFETF